MRISEAASSSGLSIDTIRFYEKVGLIAHVARGPEGHRTFSGRDVEWLRLLAALRATGMPLAVMSQFAEAYQRGDAGIAARREILTTHAEHLQQMQRDLITCQELVARKLALYDTIEAETSDASASAMHETRET